MRLQLLVLRKSLNEEERGAPVALWLEFCQHTGKLSQYPCGEMLIHIAA